MPSVKMRTTSCGPDGNRFSGKVYPVTADEGAELVAGRFADWVEPPTREERTIETATAPTPENAAVRVKARRR